MIKFANDNACKLFLFMFRKTFFTISALMLLTFSLGAQSVINLKLADDGRYTMDASVNGVGVLTYYTTESWYASVSSTTYLFLYENGYIADADIKGMTTIKMPDGSTVKAASFVIRSLKIGNNVIIKDLPAFMIKKQTVPLLVGNSAFDIFGEITQEGTKLTIGQYDDHETVASAEASDPMESLKQEAQSHLDAKEYKEAAECLSQLKENGELNAYTAYQYIVVLNILGRNDETISLSHDWLAENQGKASLLDYWVYDCLGDSYRRKGQVSSSIIYYQSAVKAYCDMFNTDEDGIRKSNFQDNTLGITLFDLSRQYALDKNLKQANYYASLAAKCGNASAQDYCAQYRIKY